MPVPRARENFNRLHIDIYGAGAIGLGVQEKAMPLGRWLGGIDYVVRIYLYSTKFWV